MNLFKKISFTDIGSRNVMDAASIGLMPLLKKALLKKDIHISEYFN